MARESDLGVSSVAVHARKSALPLPRARGIIGAIVPQGPGLGWLARRSCAISTTVLAPGLTKGVAQFVAGLMMN
jgi:hypothetical protein